MFGVRSEFDVAWGGRSGGLAALTDDGRDRIVIHLKVEIDELDANNEIRGTVQPCGVQLPPFYGDLFGDFTDGQHRVDIRVGAHL